MSKGKVDKTDIIKFPTICFTTGIIQQDSTIKIAVLYYAIM